MLEQVDMRASLPPRGDRGGFELAATASTALIMCFGCHGFLLRRCSSTSRRYKIDLARSVVVLRQMPVSRQNSYRGLYVCLAHAPVSFLLLLCMIEYSLMAYGNILIYVLTFTAY